MGGGPRPGNQVFRAGLEAAAKGVGEVRVGAFRAEFSRVRGIYPPRFFQLCASASAPPAPPGVEIQVRAGGRRRIPKAKERTGVWNAFVLAYLPSVIG